MSAPTYVSPVSYIARIAAATEGAPSYQSLQQAETIRLDIFAPVAIVSRGHLPPRAGGETMASKPVSGHQLRRGCGAAAALP